MIVDWQIMLAQHVGHVLWLFGCPVCRVVSSGLSLVAVPCRHPDATARVLYIHLTMNVLVGFRVGAEMPFRDIPGLIFWSQCM